MREPVLGRTSLSARRWLAATGRLVVGWVAVSALVVGCGTLRRRGQPIEGWRGGRYIGAECNRVMCVPDDANRDRACPRERTEPTVTERVLMAVCQPREVVSRRSYAGGNVQSRERHRFRLQDLAELHQRFDDRSYTQLEAALMATSFYIAEEGRERAYLRAIYANLVTDEEQLARGLDQVAGPTELSPEARAAFVGLVQRLRAPPAIADGATQAERHIFHDVPLEVIRARRAEFAAHADLYARLDDLVARTRADISMGRVRPEIVLALEELRRTYLAACTDACVESPLVALATDALVRLHVALDDERAGVEAAMYHSTPFHPTLAAAIYDAQRREAALLLEREAQVRDLVERGMNEAVARERVGVAGRVVVGTHSVFAAPLRITRSH